MNEAYSSDDDESISSSEPGNYVNDYIVITTFFDRRDQGITQESTPDIESHYILVSIINANQFYNSNNIPELLVDTIRPLIENEPVYPSHPVISNYRNICKNGKFFIEIGRPLYVIGGELVVILKTFWLRILQRKIRNRIKLRRETIKNLRFREINGRIPRR